jgi:signal transduction histidine kinase
LNSKRNMFIIIVSVFIIFSINFVIYFNLTKKTLESNYEREIQSIAKQVQNGLQLSRHGTELYEHMIGKMLRNSAIAAQFALPPHVDQVDNQELVRIRDMLGLQGLTLIANKNNDLVLDKSSNSEEVGLSTKDWGLWRDAFYELLEYRNVSLDWGQKLPNFWTGPYEISTADTERVSKWGYYHDGSTNYILDPYIGDEDIRLYRQITGIDSIIKSVKEAYPHILEITGANPDTFDKDITYTVGNGQEMKSLVHRPYFYGTYQVQHKDDAANVKKAYTTKQIVSTVYRSNDGQYMKTFIPIPDDSLMEALAQDRGRLDSYVLLITSDYSMIQDRLNQQFRTLLLLVAICTVLLLLVVLIIIKLVNRSNHMAVSQTAQTYIEEMNEMFLNIRGQRHDFVNHVNVIYNYMQLGKIDSLKKYVMELVGEVRQQNDIIEIGQPAISALVQSKWTSALTRKIQLRLKYDPIELPINGIQSTDIVRIMGNLIDNAFDEVEELPFEQRYVELQIGSEDHALVFCIRNPVRDPEGLDTNAILSAGYTSKGIGHQGLGLYITQHLIKKYKGQMDIRLEQGLIRFSVILPYM